VLAEAQVSFVEKKQDGLSSPPEIVMLLPPVPRDGYESLYFRRCLQRTPEISTIRGRPRMDDGETDVVECAVRISSSLASGRVNRQPRFAGDGMERWAKALALRWPALTFS
jgi:hypothetical protein